MVTWKLEWSVRKSAQQAIKKEEINRVWNVQLKNVQGVCLGLFLGIYIIILCFMTHIAIKVLVQYVRWWSVGDLGFKLWSTASWVCISFLNPHKSPCVKMRLCKLGKSPQLLGYHGVTISGELVQPAWGVLEDNRELTQTMIAANLLTYILVKLRCGALQDT